MSVTYEAPEAGGMRKERFDTRWSWVLARIESICLHTAGKNHARARPLPRGSAAGSLALLLLARARKLVA